jgi:hypothetical protein
LLAEGIVFIPESRNPSVDISGRIIGVEVVEVVLGEGLLGPFPHQSGHPGNEDVTERIGINGVNLGLVLAIVRLLRDTVFEVNVIEVFAGWLKLCL